MGLEKKKRKKGCVLLLDLISSYGFSCDGWREWSEGEYYSNENHSHPLSQSIFVFFLLFLSADVHQFCELDIDMRAVVSLGKGSDYTLSFLELDKSLVTCGSVHHFFAAILQFLKNASIKDEYGHQLYYGLSGLFWLSQTFRDAGVSLVRAAESIEWLRQRGRLIVRDMFDGKKLVDSGFM